MADRITAAPAIRYVKRGRFRVAEKLPSHEQASLDLLASLPVHGLPATTVRELLHGMAFALTNLEYSARNEPDRPISEVMMSWYVTYAAQAKALLWAARLGDAHRLTDGPDFPPDTPVPPPTIVTEDDARHRFLSLCQDEALTMALRIGPEHSVLTDERRQRIANEVVRLWDDLGNSGVCRVREPGEANG